MNDVAKPNGNHVALLKWVLAGIGAGLVALGAWVGAIFNHQISRNEESQKALRESIVPLMEKQTEILKGIHELQKNQAAKKQDG